MNNKSWELKDAQKIADEFPYTFYKPSKKVISLLKSENQAKLIFSFESDDPEAPRAERMWVEIESIKNNVFYGKLDNFPKYIQDLKFEDPITFEDRHIIDTDLDDPIPSITDKYAKRSFVTNRILYEGEKIGYFYREEPDKDDDSGWRFMVGDESEEYMDNSENLSYISLGAVLREDDSVVNYLDCKEGSTFEKNNEGAFVEIK